MRTPSLLLCLLLLAFVSCENNPLGVVDISGASPILKSASVLPASYDLDANSLAAGNRFNFTITVQVSDPQGASDVTGVSYTIFGPPGDSLISTGSLNMVMPAVDSLPITCTGAPAIVVDTAKGGAFRVEIRATDKAGHSSAAFSRVVTLYKSKRAPVLSSPGAHWLAASGPDSTLYGVLVTATDANGLNDIAQVTVRATGVKNPTSLLLYDDGLKAHNDATSGDGVYSGKIWISPSGDLHDVVFEFTASDKAGHVSNTVRRPIANSTPVFTFLNVPSTITRPSSGTSLISFFAGVRDADGIADVDSVYFKNMSSTAPSIIMMYDDGDVLAHGDSVAGDGTYSRILSIDATTTTGIKQFRFSVIDRLGAQSDSTKSITIN
jgi:hypothetical protein